jgi:hypothetical protein
MVLGFAGIGSAFVLFDEFEDGNYTANPKWTIISDQWEVVQETPLIGGVNRYLRMKSTSGTDDNGQIYASFAAITGGKFEVTMRIKPESLTLSSSNYQMIYIGDKASWTNTAAAYYNNSYFVQVINRANTGAEVLIKKWLSTGTNRVTLAQTNAYPFDGSWVNLKFTYDSSLVSDNLKLYLGDMQTPFLTATDDGTTNEPLLTNFDYIALYTRSADTGLQWGMDDVTVVPDGSKLAQNPIPVNGAFVMPSVLSWTNPEPNHPSGSIICDVYLGEPNATDPNTYNKVTLGSNVSTVAINTTNFPTYGNLVEGTKYYWKVDCTDTGTGVKTEGYKWIFYATTNAVPTVSAGADQVNWLTNVPNTVTLSGTAGDDGIPNPPGALSYTWERTLGPATAVINSPTSLTTTVSFTERGTYTFRLTADDSEFTASDTVLVRIGNDACDASHILTGDPYADADFDLNCHVNLSDLAVVAADWLSCTDTLTNCAN